MKKFLKSMYVLMYSPLLFAADGLSSVENAIITGTDTLYGLIGAASIAYVLFKAVMLAQQKIDVSDFVWSLAKVVIVAGSTTIATWLWGLMA